MISDPLVKEFQKIVKEESGMELSIEESKRAGESLVKYFELLIKIDKSKKTIDK